MSTQEPPRNSFLGRTLESLSKKASHLAEHLHKDDAKAQMTDPQHSKKPSADLSGPTLADGSEAIFTANQKARVKCWLEDIPNVVADPHTTHRLQDPKTPPRAIDVACQTDVRDPGFAEGLADAQSYGIDGMTQMHTMARLPPRWHTSIRSADSLPVTRASRSMNKAPFPTIPEDCEDDPERSHRGRTRLLAVPQNSMPSTEPWKLGVGKLKALELERETKNDLESITEEEDGSLCLEPESNEMAESIAADRGENEASYLDVQTEAENREAYFQERAEEYASRYAKCKPLMFESVKRDLNYVDADIKRVCDMARNLEDARKQREKERRKAFFEEKAKEYADKYAKSESLVMETVRGDFDYVDSDVQEVLKMAKVLDDARKQREKEAQMDRIFEKAIKRQNLDID
ncbi:hypothetical protein P7C71_g2839, partial [Lecanoromycetidae sp. Uapishka_2]